MSFVIRGIILINRRWKSLRARIDSINPLERRDTKATQTRWGGIIEISLCHSPSCDVLLTRARRRRYVCAYVCARSQRLSSYGWLREYNATIAADDTLNHHPSPVDSRWPLSRARNFNYTRRTCVLNTKAGNKVGVRDYCQNCGEREGRSAFPPVRSFVGWFVGGVGKGLKQERAKGEAGERARMREKARTGKNSLPFSTPTIAYFFQVLLPFITRSTK